MSGKAKGFWLSSLLVLLVVPLLGCGFLETLINPPTLNRQQAIAIILVAGVPYIDDYLAETLGEEEAEAYGTIGQATPFGTWDASYQGEGKWEIKGTVTTNNWGECLTTWTLSETDSKIKLIGFRCE